MAYDKNVFLSGLAAGRNMNSWPAMAGTTSQPPGSGTGSDYTKTFLAGLQLGRRLKIYDALREEPLPPVPSGLVILSEHEIPIITEYPELESNATIYRLGITYGWGDTFVGIRFSVGYLDGGGYFYWLNGDTLKLVFYGFNTISGNTGTIYTIDGEGEEQVRVGFALLGEDHYAKEVHYQSLGSPFTDYTPSGMVPFEGSEVEMKDWLSTAEYDYIITE